MPWTPSDATRHTKKARTASAKRQFAHVANKVLASTGDEGRAIREANAAVAKNHHHGKPNPFMHEAAHPHDPYPEERKHRGR